MGRGQQSTKRNRPAKVPSPPADTRENEAAVWRAVCRAQNAEWLETGPGPLLAEYCAHEAGRLRLRGMIRIEEADPDNKGLASARLYDRLDNVVAQLQRLARALRLTPQSRQRADKSANLPAFPGHDLDGDDSD